ncbi:MAG: VanW family protein [Armatimonadetes bacterium]|nr:VanW family protein [Armatimonadota bacterium]
MSVATSAKIFLVRALRWPKCAWGWRSCSTARSNPFPIVLCERRTPLRRSATISNERLQCGKEVNVALAAGRIDGVTLAPGESVSYHKLVGLPIKLRGFVEGLELRSGREAEGVGGGCCSVSNLLALLAIESGLDLVERHRHGLDLFPDHGRSVPFGCGATVFYPYADLKIRNPHDFPVRISLVIEDGNLKGQIQAPTDPSWRYQVVERDHHFSKEGDVWVRQNRICRQKVSPEGQILGEEEVLRNHGRCLYDPEAQD